MGFDCDLRRCALWPYIAAYLISLIFFPDIRLLLSSPMLTAALYQKTPIRLLWFGLIAGVFFDLLSSDFPIGFHAAAFMIACGGLLLLKQRFFSDHVSTLPIMTTFASLFQTIASAVLAPFFDLAPRFSAAWVFTDLICMPLIDGIAAFLLFVVVPNLFRFRSRKKGDYFIKDHS
jgi:hypothetical protein